MVCDMFLLPACLPCASQDMENIASVFTNKTWQRRGLKAATKSMFKTQLLCFCCLPACLRPSRHEEQSTRVHQQDVSVRHFLISACRTRHDKPCLSILYCLPLQDMENIASVFTNKTWQRGGLKAATKSMFKTKVDFKKKPAKKQPVLPTLQESGAKQLAGPGLVETGRAGNAVSNGEAAGQGGAKVSFESSSPNNSRKLLLSATGASSDAAAGST
jgi:hypothetical protein